jgi:hypothetical protein
MQEQETTQEIQAARGKVFIAFAELMQAAMELAHLEYPNDEVYPDTRTWNVPEDGITVSEQWLAINKVQWTYECPADVIIAARST